MCQANVYHTPSYKDSSIVKQETASTKKYILIDLTMTTFSEKSLTRFTRKRTGKCLKNSRSETKSRTFYNTSVSRCSKNRLTSRRIRYTRQTHSSKPIRSSRMKRMSAKITT